MNTVMAGRGSVTGTTLGLEQHRENRSYLEATALPRMRRQLPAHDGGTFGNREELLPARPMGYYREYTVPTPGARDRGARRLVAGGNPRSSDEFWYTDDHYRSFKRIRE